MGVAFRLASGAVTDDDVARFAALNPHLRVEQASSGEMIVSPPAGGWAGHCGAQFVFQLETWNRRVGFGTVYDASTGFRLPGGALRSPDVALVARERLEALGPEARRRFLPLCPDLVIEVQSPTDDRDDLRAKVQMFRASGAAVTILFDPRGDVEVDARGAVTRYRRPDAIAVVMPGREASPLTLEVRGLYDEA